MFKNFKIIANMRSPIAAIGPIILDSIISAAKAKEILEEDFYTGDNIAGEKEMIEGTLDKLLDKEYGVYCTSVGMGDNREFVGSWSKRWDDKHDDVVEFGNRGKKRIDVGAGHFKNYHMPLVLKSYKTISFYVRGDMEEIKILLENYIFYLGKKGSQGYGQIREWEFTEIEQNYSLWKDDRPMRPIPAKYCEEYIKSQMAAGKEVNVREHPIIPPYWREDCRELCVIPKER